MKNYLPYFLSILLSAFQITCLKAQNAPQITQFVFNPLLYNAAYAGYENAIQINALYRAQWTGLNGNPNFVGLSAHTPIKSSGSNAGITLTNDALGEQRTTHVHLNYAYRIPLRFGNISFGVSAGMLQHQLDGTKLRAPQSDNSIPVNNNDAFIPNTKEQTIIPEFSTAMYLTIKKMQFGLSTNNITASKSKLNTQAGNTEIKFTRYYTGSALYNILLGRNLVLVPAFLLKTDFINYQTDFNAILYFKNNIYIGASFRGNTSDSNDAVAFIFGFNLFKNFRLGYSYDYTLSQLNDASNGSHEITVGYKIPLDELVKPGKKIYSPRFL